MNLAFAVQRGGTSGEPPELHRAREEAIIWCEALCALCRDESASPADLHAVAQRAALASGRVAGFAHLSR